MSALYAHFMEPNRCPGTPACNDHLNTPGSLVCRAKPTLLGTCAHLSPERGKQIGTAVNVLNTRSSQAKKVYTHVPFCDLGSWQILLLCGLTAIRNPSGELRHSVANKQKQRQQMRVSSSSASNVMDSFLALCFFSLSVCQVL